MKTDRGTREGGDHHREAGNDGIAAAVFTREAGRGGSACCLSPIEADNAVLLLLLPKSLGEFLSESSCCVTS